RVTRACHDAMLVLLRRVGTKFSKPSCQILATGYYTIASDQSDPFGVQQLLKLHGIALPDFGDRGAEFLDPVIQRCLEFFAESTMALQQAIAGAGDPRITFVPTAFTEANAIFVPNTSLLWGLDLDDGLSPEDPVAAQRHGQCDAAHGGPLGAFARQQCYRAS